MPYLKWFESEKTPPPPPSQRVLIDMPDLVMRKILEEVDLVSIMILRKVCRAFRNYIDDTKPDSKLKGTTIYNFFVAGGDQKTQKHILHDTQTLLQCATKFVVLF
ncbi:hypothetical protein GCK72_021455 [Caenorhabditis remanei]|uniref:F-box domain-containing protein n=1 Tax=Caenorhabditis remanei TaxID=31234 RepID=A0A6A5GI72_CAERE|nr:hypothetical protein GCK72_021455 [Caenorhabditis remanei]KAF1754890.1 hypothetical protein GCK72_021455 [Caenorhabditis remanei]